MRSWKNVDVDTNNFNYFQNNFYFDTFAVFFFRKCKSNRNKYGYDVKLARLVEILK